MVEVTQTMFRRILIYALGAVFLTAGGVRAQQPEVEARIAGLEGNAEYMSLLREDAQLQIREDSIVSACAGSCARTRASGSSIRRRFCSSKAGFSKSAMPRDA